MYLTIFDLDHTLLSVNSSYQFGSYLYRRGYSSAFSTLYSVACYALHKLGIFSVKQVHKKIFNRLFKGKSIDDLQPVIDEFLNLHLDTMLYLPAIEKLQMAQQQGNVVGILSSSPDFLVKPIALRLGVKHWESTCYEVNGKNRFSGIGYIMQGEDKAQSLVVLASHLSIGLEATTVYTDSYLDEPLFKIAGKVVGVNPCKRLRALCKQRQWEII